MVSSGSSTLLLSFLPHPAPPILHSPLPHSSSWFPKGSPCNATPCFTTIPSSASDEKSKGCPWSWQQFCFNPTVALEGNPCPTGIWRAGSDGKGTESSRAVPGNAPSSPGLFFGLAQISVARSQPALLVNVKPSRKHNFLLQ